MPNLYPTFDPIKYWSRKPASTAAPPKYGSSWFFDFTLGDFRRVSGQVEVANGYEAWWQWCIKAVLTQRYAHCIYSRSYGSEMEVLVRESDWRDLQAAVQGTLVAALSINPRTRTVDNFQFSRTGATLYVTCRVTPTVGAPRDLTVRLDD